MVPPQIDPSRARHILVIKLSALGDIVQALGPLKAIRSHHPEASITVLTTAPYAALLEATGYVDVVWLDHRPKWYQPSKWLGLMRKVRAVPFDWVYDLQTSDRSNTYFRLFPPTSRPNWSGIAAGCSHPHNNPARDSMHTIDRQAEQLRMAGIAETPLPDLDGAISAVSNLAPPRPYALLSPGGASHRPGKRWPSDCYANLANQLCADGYTPVLIGTSAEKNILNTIQSRCPDAINLCDQTSLLDLVSLAGKATIAVGNDTGPLHLIAVSGCPCIALFSGDSDPALCAPRGQKVTVLRRDNLADLSVEDVHAALKSLMTRPTKGMTP